MYFLTWEKAGINAWIMRSFESHRTAKHLLSLSSAGVVATVVALLATGCQGNTYWSRSGPVRCGGTSLRCYYSALWSEKDLYANAPNTINIYYDSYHPFDSVIVAVSHGSVTKGKRPECWVFVPDSMIGRMVTVYSLALSGSGYDTFSQHDYRVVRLPDPKPVLGLFHSGLCSPEVIMRDPVVRAYNFEYDFAAEWEVLSFRVSLTDKDSTVLSDMACLGDTLPEEMREAVRVAPVYSRLTFRNVVVRIGKEERELEGFSVYVDFSQ